MEAWFRLKGIYENWRNERRHISPDISRARGVFELVQYAILFFQTSPYQSYISHLPRSISFTVASRRTEDFRVPTAEDYIEVHFARQSVSRNRSVSKLGRIQRQHSAAVQIAVLRMLHCFLDIGRIKKDQMKANKKRLEWWWSFHSQMRKSFRNVVYMDHL